MKKLLLSLSVAVAPFAAMAQEAANTVSTTVVTTAANVAPVVTTVDFSGWATAAAPIIVTLFGAFLIAGINWVIKKTGTEKLAAKMNLQTLLDKALNEATDYAVSNLKDANWLKVETKNQALGFGLSYIEEHGGDIVKMAGLDTTKVIQKLEAKLIKYDESPGVWSEDPLHTGYTTGTTDPVAPAPAAPTA